VRSIYGRKLHYENDYDYVEFLRTLASRGRLNDEDIPVLFEAADVLQSCLDWIDR
jgi:hypothetical protein